MLKKKTMAAPPVDAGTDDPESRAELMDQLYLMYQLQPRAALDSETRRQKAAYLRYECQRLGVPIPQHLKALHPAVVAHPDPESPGNFHFSYGDPWDSPNDPPRMFPDEDFSDIQFPWLNNASPEEASEDASADAAEKSAEISRWERKSLKSLRGGRQPQVSFNTEVLVQPIQAVIRTGLAAATTTKAVKDVFDYARRMPNHV